MDIHDASFPDRWKALNEQGGRYLLMGGFVTKFHGYQRYTGDMDVYLHDTLENRQKPRKAYDDYIGIDFPGFETIRFVPGRVASP